MANTYTTEDLIRILAEERRACMNGERLNLTVSPSGSPFLDKFLKPDGLQKFTAYNDFRASVHRYQQEHGISGIVWQTLSLKGQELRFPKIDDQLIAIPDDLILLSAAKDRVFEFWQQTTTGMDLYLSLNGGKSYRHITSIEVDRIWQRTEWATLSHQGSDERLEIILQLGWGKPEQASYRRGFPASGSEFIHAVNSSHYPMS